MNLAAQESGLFDGGSPGTVLMIVGMVLAVAIVSGLGFIARMNDRSAERKAKRRPGPDAPGPNAGAGGLPAGVRAGDGSPGAAR